MRKMLGIMMLATLALVFSLDAVLADRLNFKHNFGRFWTQQGDTLRILDMYGGDSARAALRHIHARNPKWDRASCRARGVKRTRIEGWVSSSDVLYLTCPNVCVHPDAIFRVHKGQFTSWPYRAIEWGEADSKLYYNSLPGYAKRAFGHYRTWPFQGYKSVSGRKMIAHGARACGGRVAVTGGSHTDEPVRAQRASKRKRVKRTAQKRVRYNFNRKTSP
jgi:hypothetical protein